MPAWTQLAQARAARRTEALFLITNPHRSTPSQRALAWRFLRGRRP